MKAKEITFEERKTIQLEMLKEIDTFCRTNNIRYTLACGTLIGAIRHGGYIPWDDDVDITMPYEDMLKFKKLFKSETMKYCDIDTEKNYGYEFSRIIHKGICSHKGLFYKSYGLCIDVYPIIECISDMNKLQNVIDKAYFYRIRRRKFMKLWNRFMKFSPIAYLPGYNKAIRDSYNFIFENLQSEGSGVYYQVGGPMKGKNNNFHRNMWYFNPFDEIIDVKFENLILKAPARYDEMLKVRYGDYMALPPDNQRHPYHGAHYYWK